MASAHSYRADFLTRLRSGLDSSGRSRPARYSPTWGSRRTSYASQRARRGPMGAVLPRWWFTTFDGETGTMSYAALPRRDGLPRQQIRHLHEEHRGLAAKDFRSDAARTHPQP